MDTMMLVFLTSSSYFVFTDTCSTVLVVRVFSQKRNVISLFLSGCDLINSQLLVSGRSKAKSDGLTKQWRMLRITEQWPAEKVEQKE